MGRPPSSSSPALVLRPPEELRGHPFLPHSSSQQLHSLRPGTPPSSHKKSYLGSQTLHPVTSYSSDSADALHQKGQKMRLAKQPDWVILSLESIKSIDLISLLKGRGKQKILLTARCNLLNVEREKRNCTGFTFSSWDQCSSSISRAEIRQVKRCCFSQDSTSCRAVSVSQEIGLMFYLMSSSGNSANSGRALPRAQRQER